MGRKAKTHDEFVAELATINPNIEVLDEYVDSQTKLKLRCLVDNHGWLATPANLLFGKGCPKCGGRSRKTHSEFLEEFGTFHKTLAVIGGTYINNRSKILVRCLLDEYVWETSAFNLLQGCGCPKCGGVARWEHSSFVEAVRTINPNVTILQRYVSNTTKLLVRCNLDNFEWLATPKHLLNGKGCRQCHIRNKTKSHEQFVKDLAVINPNVVAVSEYVNCDTKLKARCVVCDCVWGIKPNSLLSGRGCPNCAETGFNPSKHAWFYVYTFQNFLGFGITNNLKVRCSEHKTTFKKLSIEAQLLQTFEGNGQQVLDFESNIKKTLPIVDSGVKGFRTEAILYEDRELLYKAIEGFHSRHNSPLQASLQVGNKTLDNP